jgi:histidinol-phosphate/aromatic aminotransferase/cobyric acid decarboxylase-like protein
LSETRKNIAVVIDYAAMEALKGDTLVSIFKSMEILAEFPDQVVVLKSTSIICQLKGRRCGMTRRMIDKGQSGLTASPRRGGRLRYVHPERA